MKPKTNDLRQEWERQCSYRRHRIYLFGQTICSSWSRSALCFQYKQVALASGHWRLLVNNLQLIRSCWELFFSDKGKMVFFKIWSTNLHLILRPSQNVTPHSFAYISNLKVVSHNIICIFTNGKTNYYISIWIVFLAENKIRDTHILYWNATSLCFFYDIIKENKNYI